MKQFALQGFGASKRSSAEANTFTLMPTDRIKSLERFANREVVVDYRNQGHHPLLEYHWRAEKTLHLGARQGLGLRDWCPADQALKADWALRSLNAHSVNP